MSHRIINAIRRYFIAGLLVWLPIWVTLLVIRFIVDIMDQSLSLLPHSYQPATLIGYPIPGLGFVITVLLVLLTGMVATNFLGRRLVMFWDAILARIPLVRSIHAGVRQVLHTVFSSSGRSFRRVLLVEYPRKGVWTIAFLTNEGFKAAEEKSGRKMLTVFIPTTPNPTSGFLVFIPEDDVIELDISVDKALKVVISLGTVLPENYPDEDG